MRTQALFCSLAATSLVVPTLAVPAHRGPSHHHDDHKNHETYHQHAARVNAEEASTLSKIFAAVFAGFWGGVAWSAVDDQGRKIFKLSTPTAAPAAKRGADDDFFTSGLTPEQSMYLLAMKDFGEAATELANLRSDSSSSTEAITEAQRRFEDAEKNLDAALAGLPDEGRESIGAMHQVFKLAYPGSGDVEGSEPGCTQCNQYGLPVEPVDSSLSKRDTGLQDQLSRLTILERKYVEDIVTNAIFSEIQTRQAAKRDVDDELILFGRASTLPNAFEALEPRHQELIVRKLVNGYLQAELEGYNPDLRKRLEADPLEKIALKSWDFWKAAGMELLKNTGIGVIFTVGIGGLIAYLNRLVNSTNATNATAMADFNLTNFDLSQVNETELQAALQHLNATGFNLAQVNSTTFDVGGSEEDNAASFLGNVPAAVEPLRKRGEPSDEADMDELEGALLKMYNEHPEYFSNESELSKRNVSPRTLGGDVVKAVLGGAGFALGGLAVLAGLKGHPKAEKYVAPLKRSELSSNEGDHDLERRASWGGFAALVLGIAASFGGNYAYDKLFKRPATIGKAFNNATENISKLSSAQSVNATSFNLTEADVQYGAEPVRRSLEDLD